jgi:hypothetical protein
VRCRWSPLPQRYAFGDDELEGLQPIAETDAEANAHFTRKLVGTSELSAVRERPVPSMGPPPPPAAAPRADAGDRQPLCAVPMEF